MMMVAVPVFLATGLSGGRFVGQRHGRNQQQSDDDSQRGAAE
jgi:hypothetical protein